MNDVELACEKIYCMLKGMRITVKEFVEWVDKQQVKK